MLLDLNNNDAFSSASLTLSINTLPVPPTKIGDMGLFRFEGVSQLTIAIENVDGKLTLVPDAARGTMPTWQKREKSSYRLFKLRHLPVNDTIYADDVQGVRRFGIENQDEAVETLSTVVANRQQKLKDSLSLTHEWHKMGALRGAVLDADGTTELYNIFGEFGLTQFEVDFDFGGAAEDALIETAVDSVIAHIENVLGAQTYTGIHAFCGETFWRNLKKSAEVQAAWSYDDTFRQNRKTGLEFQGISWEPYRGKVNGTPYVADDAAHIFPLGVPNLFMHWGGPAPFNETVNTIGQEMYSKMKTLEWDMGYELHAQSNPLFLCTQPGVLIKANDITGASS